MRASIKKFVALLLAILVLCPLGSAVSVAAELPTYTSNTDKDSSNSDIIEISSAEDLLAFSSMSKDLGYYSGKTVVLTNDIDLNPGWDATSSTEPVNKWTPLVWFYGTFDGQGYTISGLYCKGKDTAGFISNGSSTNIKNLTVKNSYFEGQSYAGFVTTIKGWTTFENVYIDATVKSSASCAGGFSALYLGRAGTMSSSKELTPSAKFTNCVFAGVVTAKTYAGGILGSNDKIAYGPEVDGKGYGFGSFSTTLIDCANYGTIESETGNKTAGIIGICANLTNMTRCYGAGYADASLINLQKSSLEPVAKEGSTALSPATVTTFNCYFADSYGTALTKTDNAPALTIKYSNDANAAEIKAISATELITITGYTKSEGNGGWVIDTTSGMAMPNVLLCDGHEKSGEWITDTAPTVETEGSMHMNCAKCGNSLWFDSIDKLPSANESWGPNENGIFEISTVEDLLAFSSMGKDLGYYSGKTVVLTNDIDLNPGWDAASGTEPSIKWTPLVWFYGTFDGQGYAIRGLYCKSGGTAGFITNGSSTNIKNLTVKNSYFEGQSYAGFVTTIKGWTTFENVYIDATVKSTTDCAGGFSALYLGRAGKLDTSSEMSPSAKFTNCVFAGVVTAYTYAGGILGSNNKIAYGPEVEGKDYGFGTFSTTLIDCANYGTIESETGDKTAGIIGICANLTNITRCYGAGYADTAITNVQKSDLGLVAKEDSTLPANITITLIDCYYSDAEASAFTKANDSTTLSLRYTDTKADTEILTLRSLPVADIAGTKCFEATDTKDGWKTNKAQTMAMTEKLLCQSEGHSISYKSIAVSCTTEGYRAQECELCGFAYGVEIDAMLEHIPTNEWIIDIEPTTKSEGGKHMCCSECGTTIEYAMIDILPPTEAEEDENNDKPDVPSDNTDPSEPSEDDEAPEPVTPEPVTPEDEDETENEKSDASSDTSEPDISDEEEPSGFMKFINAIINFFKGIFEGIFGKKEK